MAPHQRDHRLLLRPFTAMLLMALAASLAAAAPPPQPSGALTYEKHVRPILKAHCFHCHGDGNELRGGLDVRLTRFILKGGEHGPAVVPGDSGASRMFQFIAQGKMPKGEKKLKPAEVETIRRWIDSGARTARPEPQDVADGYITEEERAYWFFQPIQRPAVPVVAGDRVRTPIDAFILARLAEHKLGYSPEADRRTLIRRVYFDLLGIPPTAAEIAAFVADDRSDAYERLIDRLLASPRYGERWGRHWLDIAGYADSEGYTEADPLRTDAWRFRDYVIRSFNDDKPFDRFVHEQLAGDEMLGYPANKPASPQDVDLLTATGFLRMAPDGTAASAAGKPRDTAANQTIADTLHIISTSLMGLTLNCAQCHDHRFDPIPQSDYFRIRAVFEPAFNWKAWRVPAARQVSLMSEADGKKAAEVEAQAKELDADRLAKGNRYVQETFDKELAKLPRELHEPLREVFKTPDAKRTAKQKAMLKEYPSCNVSIGSLYLYDRKLGDELKADAAAVAALRATKPQEHFVRALTEIPGKLPPTHLMHRGDHEQPRHEIAPGALTVVSGVAPANIPAKDPKLATSGRRLAFARWLTSPQNPFTARVIVNRIWHHHFGRGIVATPGDFGHHGELPTHPQLLDYLASDFAASGWKIKRLHKLIMTSGVYRQASRRHDDGDRVDPDNKLLWHMPVRRLEAEAVRDALLEVAGKDNEKMFGSPVPTAPDENGEVIVGIDNRDTAGRPDPKKSMSVGEEEFRRSIYVEVRRSRPLAMLATFDAANMEPNCELRSSSTVTPQSLMMMNSRWVVEICAQFARRVMREAGADPRQQAAHAWRLAFGDEPGAEQLSDAVRFIEQQTDNFRATLKTDPRTRKPVGDPALDALASYCHALCSANAFLYVD